MFNIKGEKEHPCLYLKLSDVEVIHLCSVLLLCFILCNVCKKNKNVH